MGIIKMKMAEEAIRKDDRGCLVLSIRSQMMLEGKIITPCVFPAELLKLICLHRAVDCATGLLEGEIRLKVDLNEPLDGGLPPLHLAAQNLHYDLVKLFLLHGAQPNLFCDDDEDDYAKLPLCLALEREALDTIRLLASRTQHLEKLSLHYAKEGEVVKLAALLLHEWNMLMSPYQDVECSPIGKCIIEELHSLLSNQESTNLDLLHGRKTKLECAWKMLKLLYLTHRNIGVYRLYDLGILDEGGVLVKDIENHEVPFGVAGYIISNVGQMNAEDLFCDDIECLMPRLEPKEKDWLNQALQKQMCSELHPVFTYESEKMKRSLTSFLSARSFHTFSKPNFTKDVTGQHTRTTGVVKPSLRRFLPTPRTCALLFSAAKISFK